MSEKVKCIDCDYIEIYDDPKVQEWGFCICKDARRKVNILRKCGEYNIEIMIDILIKEQKEFEEMVKRIKGGLKDE